MTGFAERLGGVLVRPRAALAEVIASGRGGVRDVSVLVALKVLAANTVGLGSAVIATPELGVGALLSGLVHAASTAALDVVAIIVGSIVMKLFVSGRTDGRELDLAACAWVPWLTVTLLVSLAGSALGRSPRPLETTVIHVVAIGWVAIVWALGLIALRNVKGAT